VCEKHDPLGQEEFVAFLDDTFIKGVNKKKDNYYSMLFRLGIPANRRGSRIINDSNSVYAAMKKRAGPDDLLLREEYLGTQGAPPNQQNRLFEICRKCNSQVENTNPCSECGFKECYYCSGEVCGEYCIVFGNKSPFV